VINKYLKGFTLTVLILFLAAAAGVQPASATSSDELNFTVKLIYVVPSTSTTYGTWESSGLLEKSGDINETIHFAGLTEAGLFVKNILTKIMFSDADGTITLRTQLHEDFFDPSTGLMGVSGTWLVADGTGAYAGLYGQGTVNISGNLYWMCPANNYGVTGPCMIETRTYTGQGHFEP
jgi:hypothetical protein